jgi:hypothetical protein
VELLITQPLKLNLGSSWRFVIFVMTSVLVVVAGLLISASPAKAATGINQQINFQARLLNSQGATVPDGNYNLEFKIYQDGDGCAVSGASPCNGTLKWTEDWLNSGTNGVAVKNGYFSVYLGKVNTALASAVDFNQDSLWLSIQVGNTSSCTITTNFQSNCGGDGEMLPFKRFASTPYAMNALNSTKLGGLTSSQFVQLAQGLQTDASTANASIAVNKTGGTASILDLQRAGASVLGLSNGGLLILQPAASLTSGQTAMAQTLTNGSSTGGTVNAFSQTITVAPAGSASTTNGINISLTDNTALTNTNKGVVISLGGSNTNQAQIGVDASVSSGIGIKAVSSAASLATQTCANTTAGNLQIAMCADSAGNNGNAGTGLYARSGGDGDTLGLAPGSGVYGTNTSTRSTTGRYYVGVNGVAAPTGVNAYTAIGVYGKAGVATSGTAATTYGGYFTLNTGSAATLGSALFATNSTVAANILQLQDSTTSVLTVADGGLITLQPAASLTSDQTAMAQTLTNGSSTGGTVNGYSQTITVAPTSSASITNGLNISLTDNTALANTNVGLRVALSGSNTGQGQYGAKILVNHGAAVEGESTGVGSNIDCGDLNFVNRSIGVCGGTSTSTLGIGVLGNSQSAGTLSGYDGAVTGINDANGSAGNTYTAVKGFGIQSAAAAYTSIGIYGKADGGAGATIYGGNFTLGTSGASLGSALYASNSSTTAKIFQLQDNTTDVLTVADGGLITLQPAASLTSGQTAMAQTLTNGSSTGGTVNGYNQTISVTPTASASTTNGINISLSDNTALANNNTGLTISLSGTNASQKPKGIDVSTTGGTGVAVSVSSTTGGATSCGGAASNNWSVGVCSQALTSTNLGTGVGSSSTAKTNSLQGNVSFGSEAIFGVSYATTTAGNYTTGVKGLTAGSGTAGTNIGVYGEANSGAGSKTYGGYFTLNSGSAATLGAALYASNSTVATNILQLQDNTTDVLTVADGGLITLQPAASLTSGQTHIAQTLTNASSTGGTVNGYSQTITVANTSSASTTNGINISLSDSTALSNNNTGLRVSLSGSNANQSQIGVDINVNHGVGLKGTSSASGGSAGCGSLGGISVGVCGTHNGGAAEGTGVYGTTTGYVTTLANGDGAGVSGFSTVSGTAGRYYIGTVGLANQSAAAAYTSVGVYGDARGGAGATTYGGYFTLQGSSATLGSALYASNDTVAANILQLQDGTTDVLTVADGGLITLQPAAALTGSSTQSHISQTLTNNQTGGTVNGYNQTITVSNASGTTTTNGINISVTDNASALANTNIGISINIASGSNTSQKQVGVDSSVARGIAGRFTTTGASGSNNSCAGSNSTKAIALCADANAIVDGSTGVVGRGRGGSNTLTAKSDAGVVGLNDANSGTGSVSAIYTGVKGFATPTNAAAYTSIGVYGNANGGAGATLYGGYFTLGASGGTAGAALYATNSTIGANILQLQDNTTDVLTVADGGAVALQNQTNSTAAFRIQNAGGTPDTLFKVDTTNNRVYVGNQNASLSTDTTLFVVDTVPDTIALPTGVNGGIIYDANSGVNKFKIYENGAWKTLCNTTDLGCGAGGSGLAKNIADTSTAAITAANYLYTFSNSSSAVASSVLKIDNGSNTGAALSVVGTGALGSNALISGTLTTASAGNLLDLKAGSSPTSKFTLDTSGNITNITSIGLSGAISGGTTYSGSGNINTTGGGIQTNSVTRVANNGDLTNIGNVTTSGASTFATTNANGFTFKPGTDVSTAFQVQNAAGTPDTLFKVDTVNNRVYFGNQSASASTDTTLLVVDSVPNGVALPTGVTGGLAYDLNSGTVGLKYYDGSAWKTLCNKTDLGCGSPVTTSLSTAYGNGVSQSDSTLTLDSTRLGIIIQDASAPISGNLLTVKANGVSGATFLGVGTSAITMQDSSGNNAFVFDSSTSTFKVYENAASPTNYAQVYYSGGEAVFAASSGTTRIGNGTGNIAMSLTNAADILTFSHTGSPAATYNTNDYSITRNLTGTSFALQGAVLKVEDTSSVTSGSISPDMLLINQNNLAAGGNLINAQLNGSSKLTVTTAGTVSIASGQSYTGAGAVTLSSAGTNALTVDSGTTGSVGIGTGANAKAIAIGNNQAGTTVDIDAGTGANGIEIGNTTSAHNISIGGGGAAAGATQAVTIGSNSTTTASKVTIQGGNITTTTNNSGVIIGGGATSDANLVPLTLDSYSSFTETASTCTNTVNSGTIYFNSGTNTLRECVRDAINSSGNWEDVPSTAGLGLMLFGVVPDSGLSANQGDWAALGGAAVGPCKVSWASSTSVSVAPCVAYSGGKKVVVSAATTISLASLSNTNNFRHICFVGGAPTDSGAFTELAGYTGNLAFSVNNPVLCIADVKTSASAITQIYDTRTFTTTQKEFVTVQATGAGIGQVVSVATTTPVANGVIPVPAALNTANLRGVVVATSGGASTTAVNAVIAIAGPQWVKMIAAAGALNQLLLPVTTSGVVGYVSSSATASTGAWGNLGLQLKLSDNATCTAATNCQMSVPTEIRLR